MFASLMVQPGFFLTPMPQPGMELTLVPLHLFWGSSIQDILRQVLKKEFTHRVLGGEVTKVLLERHQTDLLPVAGYITPWVILSQVVKKRALIA